MGSGKMKSEDEMKRGNKVGLAGVGLRNAMVASDWPAFEEVLASGVGLARLESSDSSWLILCVEKGTPRMLEALIGLGAPLDLCDASGNTAAMLASANGKWIELGMLVRAGADVAQFNHGGASAAHFAIHFGNLDCLALLLEAGADMGAKLTGRESAWDLAKEAAAHGLPKYKACIEAHREKKAMASVAAEGVAEGRTRRI
jgi:hypothetical protein